MIFILSKGDVKSMWPHQLLIIAFAQFQPNCQRSTIFKFEISKLRSYFINFLILYSKDSYCSLLFKFGILDRMPSFRVAKFEPSISTSTINIFWHFHIVYEQYTFIYIRQFRVALVLGFEVKGNYYKIVYTFINDYLNYIRK